MSSHIVLLDLLARDGAVLADLAGQLRIVPPESSHVVVSIGGNDALLQSGLMNMPVASTAEALGLFADQSLLFEVDYDAALQAVLALDKDTTVCTIYNGNLEPDLARIARVALMTFNDVILRAAFEYRLKIIDLRSVCGDPEDYANPIEPSGGGGRKIASAILMPAAPSTAPCRPGSTPAEASHPYYLWTTTTRRSE